MTLSKSDHLLGLRFPYLQKAELEAHQDPSLQLTYSCSLCREPTWIPHTLPCPTELTVGHAEQMEMQSVWGGGGQQREEGSSESTSYVSYMGDTILSEKTILPCQSGLIMVIGTRQQTKGPACPTSGGPGRGMC